jgi:hypothetical protein
MAMCQNRVLTAALFITLVFLHASPSTAQPAFVRIGNPGSLEFQIVGGAASVSGYRVELFSSAGDPFAAPPVRVVDVPAAPGRTDEHVLIDLHAQLTGIPDGDYVATVRTISGGIASPRSQPTQPFFVSSGSLTAGGASATGALEEAEAPRSRFWTKVAIAIGATIVVLPFVF